MKGQRAIYSLFLKEKLKEEKAKEMADSPVNLSQVSHHVHHFFWKFYILRHWKPLIFCFWFFLTFLLKLFQTNMQQKKIPTHWPFIQLKLSSLGTKALEPHMRFYIFTKLIISQNWIYFVLIIQYQNQRHMTKLDPEKHLALYHFYNWCSLPQLLIVSLSCSLFSMLCCAHMYVVSQIHVLLGWFFLWGKMWFLFSDFYDLTYYYTF